MRKNRLDVITLGCSKNLIDSERLMKMFSGIGYQVHHDSNRVSGEIVVINTCGFIGSAKEESIETILRMVEAKKYGKIGKLYVMGCLSERYRDELTVEIPEIDGIYGKFDWKFLLSDIDKAFQTTPSELRELTTPKHYAYVKISEGCNRKCSYCAIPLITGKYKSRTIEDIIFEVTNICDNGAKEIQLIAQDLVYYGKDIYNRFALKDLLLELEKIDQLKWIRLHYAYPNMFPKEIMPIMANSNKICHYIDIALQHASDHMLKIMRRGINKAETELLLDYMRETVPDLHIRTTMMVGHPYETEDDFEELLDFVSKQRFERLGAFAYSHEEDTYAWKNYEDNIKNDIKQERLSKLMSLQESIAMEVANKKIDTFMDVIIDREENDFYYGRTSYDSPDVDPEVLLSKENKYTVGEIYTVKIKDTLGFDLMA